MDETYYSRNRDARNSYQRKWREENKEKVLEQQRLYRIRTDVRQKARARERYKKRADIRLISLRGQPYRISGTEFWNMWAEQKGCCEACGQAMSIQVSKGSSVCLDHDHDTRHIRALLCFGCNTAYGQLQESEARIRGLLAYHKKVSDV